MSTEVILKRFASTPFGVFGRLSVGDFECYTIEREWKNNAPRISCIPNGIYPLRRKMFNRGGYETFEVESVPDRSQIKIHIGNLQQDLLGCIAPGFSLGCLGKGWSVGNSRKAFQRWMEEMQGVELTEIEILFDTNCGVL